MRKKTEVVKVQFLPGMSSLASLIMWISHALLLTFFMNKLYTQIFGHIFLRRGVWGIWGNMLSRVPSLVTAVFLVWISESLSPTPHYNCSIMRDLVLSANEDYRINILENNPNLTDGILLLKVWLKQRGLDQVSSWNWFILFQGHIYAWKTKLIFRQCSNFFVFWIKWRFLPLQLVLF
jgi:hypothetical protein